MNKNEYEEIVLEDVYDLLTNSKNAWPKTFTRAKKIEFIDRMIEYFTLKEQYEKCAVLHVIRNDIFNSDKIVKS